MAFSKKQKTLISLIVLMGILVIPVFVLADDAAGDAAADTSYGLSATAQQAYGPDKELNPDLRAISGVIIGVILAALGIIFLSQVIFGGIAWMTAAGNEEKITKAKKTIVHSVIGLVIVIAAYALVNYVMQGLFSAVFQ